MTLQELLHGEVIELRILANEVEASFPQRFNEDLYNWFVVLTSTWIRLNRVVNGEDSLDEVLSTMHMFERAYPNRSGLYHYYAKRIEELAARERN